MKLLKYGLCALLLLNSMLVQAEPKNLKNKTQKVNTTKKIVNSTKRIALVAAIGAVFGVGFGLSRLYNWSQGIQAIQDQVRYLTQIKTETSVDALLLTDCEYLNRLEGVFEGTDLPQEQKTHLREHLNHVGQGWTGSYDEFMGYCKQEVEIVTINSISGESVTSKFRIAELPNFPQIKELFDNVEARNAIVAQLDKLPLELIFQKKA